MFFGPEKHRTEKTCTFGYKLKQILHRLYRLLMVRSVRVYIDGLCGKDERFSK